MIPTDKDRSSLRQYLEDRRQWILSCPMKELIECGRLVSVYVEPTHKRKDESTIITAMLILGEEYRQSNGIAEGKAEYELEYRAVLADFLGTIRPT